MMEVWEGTSEGLFLPVVVIFIEPLKISSPRCCFYTCARLSSNMPFLPKCSRSHWHFQTCLSSVLWSMCCLSSPQPGRWKLSGYSRNSFYYSLFRRLQVLQTSGFYKALLTTSDEVEVNTLVTVTGFHGLYLIVGCAFIFILFLIPTMMSLYFFLIIFLSLMFFRCIVGFPIYLHLLMRVLYY